MNYDGQNSNILRIRFARSQNSRILDIFGNMIYGLFGISEGSSAYAVWEIDKFSRAIATNLTAPQTQISNIRAHHTLKAGKPDSWDNPCLEMQCSHLCLLNMERTNRADCACPSLESDAQNCQSSIEPEPQHPATCFRKCARDKGTCVLMEHGDTKWYQCQCHPFYQGEYCTELATITSETDGTLMVPVPAGEAGTAAAFSDQSTTITVLIVFLVIAIVLTIVAVAGFVFVYVRRQHALQTALMTERANNVQRMSDFDTPLLD